MHSSVLVDGLKQEMKARNITYADLATRIEMSEASIKRMFAQKNFTLQRLDDILKATDISLSDIARHEGAEARLMSQLSVDQEMKIVSDPKILVVAVSVLNTLTLEQIADTYLLTKAEVIKYLVELDRIGFIELLPNNRVKLLVSRTFSWVPDGPIQRYFKSMAADDFLSSSFSADVEIMRLVNLMLTPASIASLVNRLKQLAKEFSLVHMEEMKLPFEEKKGVSLLIAARPWLPKTFQELLRNK